MLVENTLFGIKDKVKIAIERLVTFEPPEGYYLAFSGGKDSVVIKDLTSISGVKYDAHYNKTTIDPPELMSFIREYHSHDVKIERPEKPFLIKMVERGFPMRRGRWCCDEYKERGGHGRIIITGVRKAESIRRADRKMIETCFKDKTKQYLNVIIDWTDEDVWEYIKTFKVPYCELYDRGFKRIGCLLCPMTSNKRRMEEAQMYPSFTRAYKRAFSKLYDKKKDREAYQRWQSGDEMFDWWLTGKDNSKPDNQLFE